PRRGARRALRVRRPRPRAHRRRSRARARPRPRPRRDARRRRARAPPDLHGDARPATHHRATRLRRRLLGGRRRVKLTVGHLYPDYLNIYADRGNIAVLTERARLRGHELAVVPIGLEMGVPPGIHLFYVGGGQDREQALVSHDLVRKGEALHAAVEGGAAFLAVCGGYQLL